MKYQRDWGNIHKRMEDEANNQGGANTDKRMYKPKFGKDGTFSALLRFLPAPGDEIPFVKKFNHRFKDKNGEYNEECPTTIGMPCPVCEKNREMWATDEKTVKRRSRGKSGISNIMVISDPQVPANNGKVFLFRYGKRILDKVLNTCFPDEKLIKTGAKAINVFDYYTGANFRLIGAKVNTDGNVYPDYTASQFDSPSVLGAGPNNPQGDEALIETVEKQLYSLKEFTEPNKIKPYAVLLASFNKVQGIGVVPAAQPAASASAQQPAPAAQPAPATVAEQAAPAASQAVPAVTPPPAAQPAPAAPAPAQQTAAPAPAQPAPAAAPPDDTLDFDAVEGQSEDDFWKNIKKDSK